MSAPKSVTKISKKGVKFVSEIDAAQYYIFELSRAALRDVGKFVKAEFKTRYYSHFNRVSGDAGRVTSVQVVSGKNTKYPRVQIGLKTGRVDGFYGYFQEFGTSKTKKLGLLTSAAQDNIAKIIEIESQYLSGLSGEAAALAAKVDENEMNIED